MFIKKVGYLLLVRLRLFHLLAKISPLVMLFSVVFAFFLLPLKEQYKFQEPSLKTKIFDLATSSPSGQPDYLDVFSGVRVLQVRGVLSNECLLVTFPSLYEQSQQISTIYHTLTTQPHLAKNVVLLSYSNEQQLHRFFQWYFDPASNPDLSFGLIRAGLNIEIRQEFSELKRDGEEKDKAFLKIYSSTLHADLDYFQASKQLLEVLGISWSPCEQVHRSPTLKLARQGLMQLEEVLRKEKSLRLFFDHLLCEFSEHGSYRMSAHEVMMQNGFQAATVKFVLSAQRQKKAEKFVVSWVNEFGMQQDHLHSANTLYYPISKTQFAPLLLFLSPSLLFFTALALHLLGRYTSEQYKENPILEGNVAVMAYAMVSEYTLTSNYTYSLWLAGLLLLLSIVRDSLAVAKGQASKGRERHCEIALLALSGLVSIYFGVFCCALSHLAIITTLAMLVKPRRVVFKLTVKLSLAILIALSLTLPSSLSLPELWHLTYAMSAQLKLCLLLPLLYYSL